MGLPSQFCPACGGPFEGFDIYDDSTGVGDEDSCWASVLSDEDIEWVEKYRLIVRTRALEAFRRSNTPFSLPNNSSNIDGLFVSDHASHVWQEGYVFILNNHDYYTFSPDKSGNIMFPIHDACLEVIEHVLESQNEVLTPDMPHATLKTFYYSLCKQYARNAMKPPRVNSYLGGLEWDHDYYGALEFQGYYDWEAGHGDEWYCANPIPIPDLTPFILSLLTKTSSSSETSKNQQHPVSRADSTPAAPRLEGLPVEILHHISSILPIPSLFALRLSSKTLAAYLYPDNQFWFQSLVSGSLIPYLWDLNAKICYGKYLEAEWDWKALARLLCRKNEEMKIEGRMAGAPIGLRNRYRIWKIIEGALEI
ncbi:hypothetical protein B0O99DRAFT_695378 [Bisporella sp. PMI_857]|nr:hypothetical protein B0O99DRAFT_695378 [Bisporella sp. PMI_857]